MLLVRLSVIHTSFKDESLLMSKFTKLKINVKTVGPFINFIFTHDFFSFRHKPIEDQTKFLVFSSCLLELFERCPRCCGKTSGNIMYINGSMVKIEQKCATCHYLHYWFSQPFVGGKPAGNLLQSAGILFSGSIPTKILKMYKFMNVPCISMSTYINHQKFYLYPSIAHVWFNYQQDYVNLVVAENRSVVLAGDGRCDSPGHCAKYGSFNVMDLQEGVVVDVQLVQVSLICLYFKYSAFV